MSATYPHARGRANAFAGYRVWLLMNLSAQVSSASAASLAICSAP